DTLDVMKMADKYVPSAVTNRFASPNELSITSSYRLIARDSPLKLLTMGICENRSTAICVEPASAARKFCDSSVTRLPYQVPPTAMAGTTANVMPVSVGEMLNMYTPATAAVTAAVTDTDRFHTR